MYVFASADAGNENVRYQDGAVRERSGARGVNDRDRKGPVPHFSSGRGDPKNSVRSDMTIAPGKNVSI